MSPWNLLIITPPQLPDRVAPHVVDARVSVFVTYEVDAVFLRFRTVVIAGSGDGLGAAPRKEQGAAVQAARLRPPARAGSKISLVDIETAGSVVVVKPPSDHEQPVAGLD